MSAMVDPIDTWSRPTPEARQRVREALTNAFMLCKKQAIVPQAAAEAVISDISIFCASFSLRVRDSVWTVEGNHTDVFRMLRYGTLWFDPLDDPMAIIVANLCSSAG